MENLKECSKCKEEKYLSEFYFIKSKNKHRAHCKKCNNKDGRIWKLNNLRKTKEERDKNKEEKKNKKKNRIYR